MLKQYIRNKARPEGSVVEAYVMNESSTLCSRYLSEIKNWFSRDEWNHDGISKDKIVGEFEMFMLKVRPLGATSSRSLSQEEKYQIHWYILNTVDEIVEYSASTYFRL